MIHWKVSNNSSKIESRREDLTTEWVYIVEAQIENNEDRY